MAESLLAISGLAAGYGAPEVLRDIELAVAPGEIDIAQHLGCAIAGGQPADSEERFNHGQPPPR